MTIRIQGKDETTKLRHVMRQLRGAYIANVKAGRCKMDEKVLAEFDANLASISPRKRSK